MTCVRRDDAKTHSECRRFIIGPAQLLSERNHRLRTTKSLREGHGEVGSTPGLVTYVFSRLRCKPTASRLPVGLRSGAGVADAGHSAEYQDIMSDSSNSTILSPTTDEQHHSPKTRQYSPNVRGGGVQCQGGTPDTTATERAAEPFEYRENDVRSLGCQGCQGSKRNYRVRRERAPAPARLSKLCVWTPDTPDGEPKPPVRRLYVPLSKGRVSAPRYPPTHDTSMSFHNLAGGM